MALRSVKGLLSQDDETLSFAEQIIKETTYPDIEGELYVERYWERGGGVQVSPAPALVNMIPVPPLHLRPGDKPGSEKIVINVGGKRFVTYRSTLETIPKTRISDLNELDPSYDFHNEEYFFDRNPRFFASILDYFRTGELHFAHCLCGPSIKTELDFWRVSECHISNCCWRAYTRYEEEQATLAVLAKALNDGPRSLKPEVHYCRQADDRHSAYCRSRRRLWDFLEHPQSSKPAQVCKQVSTARYHCTFRKSLHNH